MTPGRAIDGQNWYVTADGTLRPGPGTTAFVPGACFADAVLNDPASVTVATLRDLATHSGHIWLNQWKLSMEDPHAGFILGGAPDSDPASRWSGRYFDRSELSDADVRTRTLKLSFEEQGVARVWVLDDRVLVANTSGVLGPEWTSDGDSSCGAMRTAYDGLQLDVLDPLLVIYDSGCMELTGWLHWSFLLKQGLLTATDEVMDYDFELGFLGTTGTVRALGRSYALAVTGAEEETTAQNALLASLPRWPLLDQKMLQDPNLVHLGVCAPADGGACANVYLWRLRVYYGKAYGNNAGYICPIGAADVDEFFEEADSKWMAGDRDEDIRSIYAEAEGDEAYPVVLGHEETQWGVTLCEFIRWLGGPYMSPGGQNWCQAMLAPGSPYDYYTAQLFPRLAQVTNFLFVWEGKVCVPASGLYVFYLMEDDAAVVKIDGEVLFAIVDAEHDGDDRKKRGTECTPDVNEHRSTFGRYLDAGEHTMEVRWLNNSPYHIWHMAVCPDAGLNVTADPARPKVFPFDCKDGAPDNTAPCCRGLDALIGCEVLICEWHLTTDAADAADFATLDVEPIEPTELTDCYGPLVTI